MIDERIPELSDKELERLHVNAVRLVESGTANQREQAERLLPLLSAALEERKTARIATQSETRRTAAQRRSAMKVKAE